ncbi:MAG: crotonobetainyl-CoA hydratase [Nocardiopsaceae bacterium]|nr:crotonobetainyl-CoA hydratase [Nocardiopsaceae bacterium]
MAGTPVRTQASGGVLTIILDRPRANAVDVATSHALYDAFARLETDSDLRAGIITGEGDRFFCAGWDLKAAAAGEPVDADHGPGGFAGLTELHGRRKPVIAAVNGIAAGGGFELALAADLVVAAEHAQFSLPEATLGIIPDSGGVLRLPRRLPRPIALELLLTGRVLSAEDALEHGLVNQVVPGEQLMDAAQQLASRIMASAPLAVAAILEVLDATDGQSIQAGYATLRSGKLHGYVAMLGSQDATEGPAAFAERRPPEWKGR